MQSFRLRGNVSCNFVSALWGESFDWAQDGSKDGERSRTIYPPEPNTKSLRS